MKTAPAKLLLLGEHTVLHGSAAFAIPLRKFSAQFIQINAAQNEGFWNTATLLEPNRPAPLNFLNWWAFAKTCPTAADFLDFERWQREAEELFLSSDIPIGYGLGSSGAITALTFSRFRKPTVEIPALAVLRTLLGELEGYFHGKSSGLDPLVSFCNQGILIDEAGHVNLTSEDTLLPNLNSHGGWFLLDSGRPRAGREAITRFGESCENKTWREQVLEPLLEQTQLLVDIAAKGRIIENPLTPLKKLSEIQLEHLKFLIPIEIQGTWRNLLDSNEAYLKLCGAGGGGFFLGYALHKAAMQENHPELIWL